MALLARRRLARLGRRRRGSRRRYLDLLRRHGLAAAAATLGARAVLVGHRLEIVELRLSDRHEYPERTLGRRQVLPQPLFQEHLQSVPRAQSAARDRIVHQALALQAGTLLRQLVVVDLFEARDEDDVAVAEDFRSPDLGLPEALHRALGLVRGIAVCALLSQARRRERDREQRSAGDR